MYGVCSIWNRICKDEVLVFNQKKNEKADKMLVKKLRSSEHFVYKMIHINDTVENFRNFNIMNENIRFIKTFVIR